MTNVKREAATQAATSQPAVPVVVQGQPVVGAVVGLTEEQKTAMKISREAEFEAQENSLSQRLADSGYGWVTDNVANEHYIGQRPEALNDPRNARVIQFDSLMTLGSFDGREVRTPDGSFVIQGFYQDAGQIINPLTKAPLIGAVDKKKSAERRKIAEARWKEEDERFEARAA